MRAGYLCDEVAAYFTDFGPGHAGFKPRAAAEPAGGDLAQARRDLWHQANGDGFGAPSFDEVGFVLDLRDHLKPGLTFDDYVERVSLSRYLALPEGETPEAWAVRRRKRHEDRHVIFNVRLIWDRWLQISEHRTANGGTVIIQTDVTDIIRLERDTQLLIPAYDYCMPDKECQGSTEDDPCTLFSRIRFPVEEFFPPNGAECDESYRDLV